MNLELKKKEKGPKEKDEEERGVVMRGVRDELRSIVKRENGRER